MKPVRLLLVLATVNVAAIVAVMEIVIPPQAASLDMQELTVQQPVESQQLKSGKPEKLVIDSVGINIEVLDGEYDPATHKWSLAKDKAHYALMTPLANNQAGNTFIYGHNNKKVFTRLEGAKVGDVARIHTANGVFAYKLRSIKEVSPDDTSIFEYRGSSILTIQTCSGSWYEKRKLFTFDYMSYEAKQ
jgi:LPXTG-site transpeptidase (sortase) family protein